jgi:hypothetical protein
MSRLLALANEYRLGCVKFRRQRYAFAEWRPRLLAHQLTAPAFQVAAARRPHDVAAVVDQSAAQEGVKQGSFVGVTAMPQADGSQSALEVHIFTEACAGQEKDTTHGIFDPRAP